MIHYLKTITDHFQEVWDGNKPFEIRKNDRKFHTGDILILGEGIGETQAARAVIARVENVTDANEGIGLLPDHVGLGLRILAHITEDELSVFEYSTGTIKSEQWNHSSKAKEKIQRQQGIST